MPEFNAFQIVLILGLVNGGILFFSLSSLPKKFKTPAKILGFFIVGYTAYVSNWTVFSSLAYHFNFTPIWVPTLYFLPALAYFFSKSILTDDQFSTRDWPFLIPGFLDLIFQISKWIWYTINIEGYYFPMDDRKEFFIYEGIGLLFATFCIYRITMLIKAASLKRNESFKFYKYSFYFLLLVLVRWYTIYIIDLLRPELLTFRLQFSFWFVDLVFFLFLGYRSLVMPGKYITKIAKQEGPLSSESEWIVKLIESEKLFLSPDFTRKDLSQKADLSEVKISGIFSNDMGTTFYELVNGMRALEAKRLLELGEASKLTMEAIAKKSGFKSKTTFYKFFKSEFGQNPKEYLKSLQ